MNISPVYNDPNKKNRFLFFRDQPLHKVNGVRAIRVLLHICCSGEYMISLPFFTIFPWQCCMTVVQCWVDSMKGL